LAPAIRYLSRWFDLFNGEVEDLKIFAKSLWLWCDFLAALQPHLHGLEFLTNKIRARFAEFVTLPVTFEACVPKISQVLKQAVQIVNLLTTIEQSKRVPEKYAALSYDLTNVAEQMATAKLPQLEPVVLSLFKCSVLRLRLYVVLPELENFAVCCHNVLYLEEREKSEGLQQLLAAILPSFPTSPEMRTQVRALLAQIQAESEKVERPTKVRFSVSAPANVLLASLK
jgi:hypothetical protein